MRQQDVEVLIGIVATMTGRLYGGQLDPETTRKFAERLVRAGLLSRAPDGSLPPAAKARLALEDLGQRHDFATPMETMRWANAGAVHDCPRAGLPSEDAALDCKVDLPDGQARDPMVRYENVGGWLLFAFYPELLPDQDFNERMAELRQTVERHGGRYTGHQGPPR
jgi:hypothetical protein